jgi:hypothetical protein
VAAILVAGPAVKHVPVLAPGVVRDLVPLLKTPPQNIGVITEGGNLPVTRTARTITGYYNPEDFARQVHFGGNTFTVPPLGTIRFTERDEYTEESAHGHALRLEAQRERRRLEKKYESTEVGAAHREALDEDWDREHCYDEDDYEDD